MLGLADTVGRKTQAPRCLHATMGVTGEGTRLDDLGAPLGFRFPNPSGF